MGRVWEARRAGSVLADETGYDRELILRAYRDDVAGIPVLGDLEGFQDLARQLEPESFSDMVKIMGLCLAPEVWFQAERLMGQPDRFDRLIGTREDVYDLCVRHGVGGDDAFQVMRQVSHGRLSPEYKDILTSHGICGLPWDTLCADYMYWALTLLARA